MKNICGSLHQHPCNATRVIIAKPRKVTHSSLCIYDRNNIRLWNKIKQLAHWWLIMRASSGSILIKFRKIHRVFFDSTIWIFNINFHSTRFAIFFNFNKPSTQCHWHFNENLIFLRKFLLKGNFGRSREVFQCCSLKLQKIFHKTSTEVWKYSSDFQNLSSREIGKIFQITKRGWIKNFLPKFPLHEFSMSRKKNCLDTSL